VPADGGHFFRPTGPRTRCPASARPRHRGLTPAEHDPTRQLSRNRPNWWARSAETIWDEHFGDLNPANFGIAGDTTQGVLWRMQNGELDGFQARLIVHMLGTNNINRNENADIVAGNAAIIEEYRTRQPQAKVLVLGVFPRGEEAGNPFRAAIAEINAGLEDLADNEEIFYMDLADAFLSADGTLSPDIFPDGLHPNEAGYQIWADAMTSRVRELME
jgi:lysophospholipase L1-like esterase